MRQIKICDITLSELNTNQKLNLSFKEKLEVAKRLEELRCDCIEVGPLGENESEAILVRTMASFVKNATISVVANLDNDSVEKAINATKSAANKEICLLIPTSTMQMEYISHRKAPKVLEAVSDFCSYISSKGLFTRAILADATRGDLDFLNSVISTAISSGAKGITICDDASAMLPDEFKGFLGSLKANNPAMDSIELGISTLDSLSLGIAETMAALECGVDVVTASVVGENVPNMLPLVNAINNFSSSLAVSCQIDTTSLKTISEILNNRPEGAKTLSKTFAFDNDEVDKNITEADLKELTQKLGYELNSIDSGKAYETFKRLASKKKVTLKEIDVIVANIGLSGPALYNLDNYVINSGNKIFSTASICLYKNDTMLYGLSKGDGPIDASFKAIEEIIGHHFELEDFQVTSATEGREAIGEAMVKLRYNGKLYSGRGISTDIIGAAIRAFVASVNKVFAEDNEL